MVWHHITPHIREVVEGTGDFVSSLPLTVSGIDLVSDTALARLNAAARRILRSDTDVFSRPAPRVTPSPATQDGGRGAVGDAFQYPEDTAGYRFVVAIDGITVTAPTSNGAVQALASITQGILLSGQNGPAKSERRPKAVSIVLPAATIADAPRSQWRGFMVDVARHFFPVSALQELLDLVWLYRLNRFHIHLTDDQGWRFPVAGYPELTRKGAYRDDSTNKDTTYGGSYSQEELRRFDGDAAFLGVTVVPEIDLPGHASSALTAYPELGCTGEVPGVQQRWGIFQNVICAASPKTPTFLESVYSAIAATFSGPFIHIGGDEVPEEAWLRCSRCRDLDDPYQTVVRKMTEVVLSKGKRPVAWDEAANLDLPKETIIINWRRAGDAAAALARGYDIVLAPERSAAYLDHKHRDTPHEPGRLGVCTVTDSASFSPESYVETNVAAEGLPPREADRGDSGARRHGHITGGQGNLWTEEIPYLRNIEYMALLRLAAIADGLWGGSPMATRPSWRADIETLRHNLLRSGYNVYPGLLD